MFQRLCKPLLSNSFFMFGARTTGKSALVREVLRGQRIWELNLLLDDEFDRFSRAELFGTAKSDEAFDHVM